MKTLLTCLFSIVSIVALAQSSPMLGEASPSSFTDSRASIGDTANFTPFVQNEIITNQYESAGMIFQGWGGTTEPRVQDYTSTYGKTLRSSDWFGQIRVDFVDPSNPSNTNLISTFSLGNPIDTEVDYTTVQIFDQNDVLIHQSTGASPSTMFIDLGSAIGAYAILDDSLNSAYVVDNLVVNSGITVGIDQFESTSLGVYPNPTGSYLTISLKGNGSGQGEVYLTDLSGKHVHSFGTPSIGSGSFNLEIPRHIPGGTYLVIWNQPLGILSSKLILNR